MSRKYRLFTIYFLLSLILDQASKIWARQTLKPRFDAMVIIPNFFDLRFAENPGTAFSLLHDLSNGRVVLAAIGIGALGLMLVWLKRLPSDSGVLAIALGLIAGGALGNIIDRVQFGKVTDFIVWKVNTHQWPTFNIADATLVIGIGLALIYDKKKPATK